MHELMQFESQEQEFAHSVVNLGSNLIIIEKKVKRDSSEGHRHPKEKQIRKKDIE